MSWVQTEADDDNEPTWLVVVVRCLKKKDEKNPPRLAIASEGVGCWVVMGADGGR